MIRNSATRDTLIVARVDNIVLTFLIHFNMVRVLRSARIESGQVRDDDGALPQDSAIEPSPGGDPSSPTKKRRRLDATESPKKRRRRKREELCQLNLDVLFLVNRLLSLFVDRLLMDTALIDREICSSYGPPESCPHVQVSSGAADGQILDVRLEDRSPSGRWPA